MKTMILAALMVALLFATVIADDEAAGTSLSVAGLWKSTDGIADRSLSLQFDGSEFTIHMKTDTDELNGSGLFQQEDKKIYLILRTSDKKETQIEVNYEVIDANTMDVVLNRKHFTLERQN